ncbi:MAG: type II toxin-antitoxin system VapC family toxin [Acidobacteria bacterium]|nr:type II toxin-antitoxin system VapC family toxin [Acidobacteriota bacterium]
MIVLDASAVVELVLATSAGRTVAMRISNPALSLHAPHLLDVEVAQALRRCAASRLIDEGVAAHALAALHDLDLERHPHDALLERVWALRCNLTAYDAVYVALAEALGAVLLTCDARLARAPGLGANVELVTHP